MKVATMSTADCEALLGARGRLQVNSENRREVRKWLNSQGFPALFSGGLSMRELALAYNDTSGREVEKLRRKLSEASEGLSQQEEQQQDTAQAAQGLLEAIAQTEGRKGAQITMGDSSDVQAMERESAAHQALAQQAGGSEDDLQAAARKLAEAIARHEGKTTVDAEQVKSIVRNELKDLDKKLEGLTTTRIEVKLPDADAVTVLEGMHHPKFETLLKAAASREVSGFRPNIMLSGPAGSGKTFAAKNVVKALGLGWEYNGALSMAHEVLGYQDAAGVYHETSFYRGYTGPNGYVFDEVDGSDNSPLLALNAALANGTASFPHGMFPRHQDSLIIATANTWGLGATADYVGRSKLDAAFLSRFPIRIYWDYDEKLEAAICGNGDWAKRVQRARHAAKKAGIKVIICPRISIAGAALIAGGFTAEEAAEVTYLANLSPEQRTMIENR